MSKYTSSVASLAFLALSWLPNVVRWEKRNVTLRIDPALEQMLQAGQVRSAALMASDAWRGFASVPDITIEDGTPAAYDAGRRGNGIYLLAKWPFKANQLAVTVVTYAESGEVLGVDVLVNGEKQFALFSEGQTAVYSERYDLAAVLTHELGHVLGLDESYEHPEATMFPQIHQGETHQRLISEDDQQAVTQAYLAPFASSSAKAGCSVTGPHAASAGNGMLGCVVGLLSLVAVRSRRRALAA
jgi:predicted Zn-dependent protease